MILSETCFSQHRFVKHFSDGVVFLKNDSIVDGRIKILYPFGSSSIIVDKSIIDWSSIEKIKMGETEIYPRILKYQGYSLKSYFYNGKYLFYHRKQYGKNNWSLKTFVITILNPNPF